MYKYLDQSNASVVHLGTSRCVYLNEPSTAHTEAYMAWVAEGGVTEPYTAPVVVPSTPEQLASLQAAKIEALWSAADRYVSGYISGVAIGILTIGVIQSKPKALAVTAWSSGVWADYYSRKSTVTAQSVDNHDFTSHGPIPYSVPELQAEVWL